VMSDNSSRIRAIVAHQNARRFAEQVRHETDEAMKAYWRHLAVSRNDIAEQHEFLAGGVNHQGV